MKQTTKRFYGTLVGVAFLSGLTGAFAYSLSQKSVDKVLPSFSFTEPKKAQEPVGNLMTLSTASAPAVQPVDLTEAAEKACNVVTRLRISLAISSDVAVAALSAVRWKLLSVKLLALA